jgi:VWFA-related protein
MRRDVRTIVAAVVAIAAGVSVGARVDAQDAAVFRANADAVTVGVSVQRGGRPVPDLAQADFELTDNGVAQTIGALSYEKLPIDLTVLLDVSTSVNGRVLDQLRRAVNDLRKNLRPQDRLRLVAVNMRIQRLVDFDAPPAAIDAAFANLTSGGASAVLDALAVSLASAAPPDRRQFAVIFTDGKDSISINTPDMLLDTARRTTAAISVVLATPLRRPADRIYTDLANETGGQVVSLLPGETFGDTLQRALDQFRSSYVLTYTPTGVERTGAHALAVHVKRGGVDVRARKGYEVR